MLERSGHATRDGCQRNVPAAGSRLPHRSCATWLAREAPLKDAFRALQLLTTMGGEIPATSIDEVLNHSDPGTQPPLGDTSGLAMMSTISCADRVNVPRGGAVEIVVTVCTQRRRLVGVFRTRTRPYCSRVMYFMDFHRLSPCMVCTSRQHIDESGVVSQLPPEVSNRRRAVGLLGHLIAP